MAAPWHEKQQQQRSEAIEMAKQQQHQQRKWHQAASKWHILARSAPYEYRARARSHGISSVAKSAAAARKKNKQQHQANSGGNNVAA